MPVIFEVLQYTLKKGTGHQFHFVMLNQSIPLHIECGLKVVTYGNSLDDSDKYFLIRTFPDIGTMEQKLEAFYADERWRNGPRTAIVSMIEESHRVLLNEFNI
ncbi:NIPSNAP family protein [Pantoea agglomerans]|uniref:NIPSNAP family protein n=1 Tax=Enterobacter agglomerans TaxID=549 RepID=UPI00104B3962|nr:NIPSNAP family protein [Pantoea agglomerans]TCZ22261.1 NIPSNAP family protein [Pantoea agglomerans]